eukprot:CAMPEP_0117690226 /NCGR_PEP_ID=MMETSP0804-20121206/25006_2 /TAXON_ID=1074897 /ORGANISM="Tetraselmis astigmatica, Strain CCMP880" /LENGTH=157 /DNA_ID=CAMNT_0005503243 /DNA_START=819 /DNA_END=1289 /DNA_ORIENTATION=-
MATAELTTGSLVSATGDCDKLLVCLIFVLIAEGCRAKAALRCGKYMHSNGTNAAWTASWSWSKGGWNPQDGTVSSPQDTGGQGDRLSTTICTWEKMKVPRLFASALATLPTPHSMATRAPLRSPLGCQGREPSLNSQGSPGSVLKFRDRLTSSFTSR